MTSARTVDLTVRVADHEDAPTVRACACAGRRPRYGETAQKLIRRCGAVLAGTWPAPPGFTCLLFEDDGTLVAVSAVKAAEPGVCDWIVMGVARTFQGARVADGRSVAVVVVDETLRAARIRGSRRIVAMVHRDHATSRFLLRRVGFAEVAAVDDQYGLFAAACA
jgi:hypothetical protein